MAQADKDVMRRQFRELSELEQLDVRALKEVGEHLWKILDALGDSRELSLAKTKVEEAVMWGVKHVTRTPTSEELARAERHAAEMEAYLGDSSRLPGD